MKWGCCFLILYTLKNCPQCVDIKHKLNKANITYVVNQDVAILCGAGIGTGTDVETAIKLGSQGVLLASAVAKSDTPEEVLKGLAKPLAK